MIERTEGGANVRGQIEFWVKFFLKKIVTDAMTIT